jgi:glycosyl transferase family 25
MELKKYFDKIYCINLDRRPDRWKKVQKEFEINNIKDVERYSAIDGNTLINNTKLLNGELGILETHYNLIKKCKEDNLNNVLIIEDDVCFTSEFKNFEDYISKVPDDWDFIFLGGNHVYGIPPIKINDKVLKLNHTVSLHCVVIKNTLFDVILNILSKKTKQVDSHYADLQKVYNAYCFYPNLAKQLVDFSDIQNKVVDYEHFFKD